MILLNDHDSMDIRNEEELNDVIAFRIKNDQLFVSKINEMEIFRIRDNESPYDFKVRTAAAMPVSVIQENRAGLFLSFYTEINGERKHAVLPVRYTAIDSLLERARVNCFTMSNMEEQQDALVMSLDEKIAFINKAFKLYSGFAQILFRDEKITSVMSGQYCHITMKSLDDGVNALKEDFPDLKFKTGVLSHEMFKETYNINSDELEEDILLSLQEAGINAQNVSIEINAHTSDHGKIAATFYGRIVVDDMKLLFGSPESVKHSGKKDAELLKAAAKKLYASFQNNQDKIKALPQINIDHPDGCLRMIAKEYRLPKKIACELADTLVGKTDITAYEIYWLLNKIVILAEERGMDPIRVITLQDMVARTLNASYKKFDKEFLWARGEEIE